MMPKVSVVVPVFNAERWLPDCAESLLNQSYQNTELIFVDDGSQDGSLTTLREINDKRVTVIAKGANSGVGPARNTGIRAAQGELIAFVDADDWLDRNYIEEAAGFMTHTKADLVITSLKSVRTDRARIFGKTDFDIEGPTIYKHALLTYYRRALASCGNKLYRSQLIQDHRVLFSNIVYGEDYEFNLKYMFHCTKISLRPTKSCYYYRQDVEGSATSTFTHRHLVSFAHLICLSQEYGRDCSSMLALRQLRSYELFASCRRQLTRASSSTLSTSDERKLREADQMLRPLVISPAAAFIILLLHPRLGFTYRAKKIWRIFLRNPMLLRPNPSQQTRRLKER